MPSLIALLSLASLVAADQQVNNFCASIMASEAQGAVGSVSTQIYAGQASYTYNLDLTNLNTQCDLSAGLVSCTKIAADLT